MFHTLYKRKERCHETQIDEQEDIPQKLQKRNRRTRKEFQTSTNARRRSTVEWLRKKDAYLSQPTKNKMHWREPELGNILDTQDEGET